MKVKATSNTFLQKQNYIGKKIVDTFSFQHRKT